MSNTISKDNLRLAAQRSKNFTNSKILELTEAIESDFADMINFFALTGLYIDNDGDIAQPDEVSQQEEES